MSRPTRTGLSRQESASNCVRVKPSMPVAASARVGAGTPSAVTERPITVATIAARAVASAVSVESATSVPVGISVRRLASSSAEAGSSAALFG
jgi:hypothetical protein